jgi:DNA modification methylase
MQLQSMTVAEAAQRWGITERRVLALCKSGRIEGALKFGWSWAIPVGAKKPIDARRKDEPEIDDILSVINGGIKIKIERTWAMPNSRTFEITPIKELILSEMTEGLWIDPFANNNKLAKITNDLNPQYETDYHMDALDFLKMFEDSSVDGILYDPPYSPRQVSECYNNVGYNVTWDTTKASFWGNHKREISRIVRQGGKVITFGWNSGGIGMKNGFQIIRILLVPHGGWHNDTICTVEIKRKDIEPMPQISLLDYTENTANAQASAKDDALLSQLSALPNGFWDFKNADTREYTHGLHTYPAVMVSPISRNILKIMQSISPVNSLLDPFSGSGTVLVEGVVSGVKLIYGNDLNPLARLISSVKTTPLDHNHLNESYNQLMMAIEYEMEMLREIREYADEYISAEVGLDITTKDKWGSNAVEYLNAYLSTKGVQLQVHDFKNIGYWFRPQVIIDLQIIKNCINEIPYVAEKKFFLIAFSETIRIVSNRRNGEFKMFRMPIEKIYKFNPDVKQEFHEILKRNIEKMLTFSEICKGSEINVSVLSENAMDLTGVADASIDLMITSPPYGDSRTTVAYGEFSKLSLQWMGLDGISADAISAMDRSLMGGEKYRNGFEFTLESDTLRSSLDKIKEADIERAGDVFSFYTDLEKAIAAISKKMKQGGYQFWVVGNRTVKLENLQTDKILIELSRKHGLIHVYSINRNIPNKVMPSSNSPSNVAGEKVTTMINEYIVIFRKK